MRRLATARPYAELTIELPSPEHERLWEAMSQPLHIVAARGQLEVVRAKLAHGAQADEPWPNGTTPLHWAAYCDRAEVARLLLDHGAALEARDPATGSTPLLWAATGRGAAALRVLLAAGARTDAVTLSGEGALTLAKRRGDSEAIALLRRARLHTVRPR